MNRIKVEDVKQGMLLYEDNGRGLWVICKALKDAKHISQENRNGYVVPTEIVYSASYHKAGDQGELFTNPKYPGYAPDIYEVTETQVEFMKAGGI